LITFTFIPARRGSRQGEARRSPAARAEAKPRQANKPVWIYPPPAESVVNSK